MRNPGRVFLLLWVRMPGDTAVEAPVGDNDKKIDEPVEHDEGKMILMMVMREIRGMEVMDLRNEGMWIE